MPDRVPARIGWNKERILITAIERFGQSCAVEAALSKILRQRFALLIEKIAASFEKEDAEYVFLESFNARIRDELLDGEIFYSLQEARVIIEPVAKLFGTPRITPL